MAVLADAVDPIVAQRARAAVWTEIWAGRMKRGQHCEKCKVKATDMFPMHAHHDDYSKPLAIRWLCASCHKRHHIALRKANGTFNKAVPGSKRASRRFKLIDAAKKAGKRSDA